MPIHDFKETSEALVHPPSRAVWTSVKRGLRGRCPACGGGRLLNGYLKVHDHCLSCGEEMHHHRADDFPQYVTIFVVGHVLAAALLLTDELWPDLPMAFHYVVWPALVVILCLWLLPVFKGGLVAYQWALRMHGFETAHATLGQEAEKPITVAQRSAA